MDSVVGLNAPSLSGPRLATIVVITPMATLVTNKARTRPLIARKPPCGLSVSRRAAVGGAGPCAAPAKPPRPRRGQQGPGDHHPRHDQEDSGEKRCDLSVRGAGAPADEVGHFAQADQKRDQAVGP